MLRGELKLININYTRAGVGLQDAQSNGFVGALRNNASAKMGLIHSVYGKFRFYLCTWFIYHLAAGAGAFISPIIATQFAQRPNWSYHYLFPLVMTTINILLLYSVFGFHTQEGGSTHVKARLMI